MTKNSTRLAGDRAAISGAVRLVALVFVLALALALATVGTGAAAAESRRDSTSLGESPPGQVLVVDANLLEAFSREDVADPIDMENFVRRLLSQVPYAPDALLLQEVVGPSAENVARIMTAATGFTYVVAAGPGESHVVVPATATTPEIRRETAILLNVDTMRLEDSGGYVENAYARADHRSGTWMTKQEPYLMAKELRGGLSTSLLSLHYVPNSRFTSADVGFRYKAEWSGQIAQLLDDAYPSPSRRQVEVIGGDFNNRPCVEVDVAASDPGCTPMPFWQVLTGDHGYISARDSGIDYIFARGEILDSGFDAERKAAVGSNAEFAACKDLFTQGRGDDATGTCATEFYADHSFLWALVGMAKGPGRG
ncbi:MAG: hypothetical protein M3450_09330 [Actinomycetota bacterium]|nr:hypothetical protein [Actinomycetota bacterium]